MAEYKLSNEISNMIINSIVNDNINIVNKFKDFYSVELMCKVLDLNRSTYYKEFKRKPTKTQISNDELDSKILKVYYDSKRRYGAPKIFYVLRKEGETG